MPAPEPRPQQQGRPIPDPGFPGDDGSADPGLAAVLSAYDAGTTPDADVYAAVAAARLIVPMTALPTAVAAGEHGQPVEKSVEMALPVMLGTDGRRALPAFTSLETLARWDPAARPVPVEAARAAAGALQEGCSFLVLDPAGPVTWVADRAQVEAMAGSVPDKQ